VETKSPIGATFILPRSIEKLYLKNKANNVAPMGLIFIIIKKTTKISALWAYEKNEVN